MPRTNQILKNVQVMIVVLSCEHVSITWMPLADEITTCLSMKDGQKRSWEQCEVVPVYGRYTKSVRS